MDQQQAVQNDIGNDQQYIEEPITVQVVEEQATDQQADGEVEEVINLVPIRPQRIIRVARRMPQFSPSSIYPTSMSPMPMSPVPMSPVPMNFMPQNNIMGNGNYPFAPSPQMQIVQSRSSYPGSSYPGQYPMPVMMPIMMPGNQYRRGGAVYYVPMQNMPSNALPMSSNVPAQIIDSDGGVQTYYFNEPQDPLFDLNNDYLEYEYDHILNTDDGDGFITDGLLDLQDNGVATIITQPIETQPQDNINDTQQELPQNRAQEDSATTSSTVESVSAPDPQNSTQVPQPTTSQSSTSQVQSENTTRTVEVLNKGKRQHVQIISAKTMDIFIEEKRMKIDYLKNRDRREEEEYKLRIQHRQLEIELLRNRIAIQKKIVEKAKRGTI